MDKTTYYIISGLIYCFIVIGGRLWLGLSFIERIIYLILMVGLFEIIYNKIKKQICFNF